MIILCNLSILINYVSVSIQLVFYRVCSTCFNQNRAECLIIVVASQPASYEATARVIWPIIDDSIGVQRLCYSLALFFLSEWAVNMGEILSILVRDEETNISFHTPRIILIKIDYQNPDFCDEGIFISKCISLWVLYLSTCEEVRNIF